MVTLQTSHSMSMSALQVYLSPKLFVPQSHFYQYILTGASREEFKYEILYPATHSATIDFVFFWSTFYDVKIL